MKHSGEKKVLIVTPYFPPHMGGLEGYAFEIARRLSRDHTWHVVVVTSGARWGADEKQELEGLTVYRLGYSVKISNTPFGFGWFSKMRRILQSEDPDSINVHMPVPGIGDIAAYSMRKKPLVVTYHAGSMKKGGRLSDIIVFFYEKTALRYLLHRADRIVCSSEAVRCGFLRAYRGKSVTIRPAVDHDLFMPRDAKNQGNTLLFVASELSRACEYKGLAQLIEAMSMLRQQGIEARLVVVGDGDMQSDYEASARAQGLEDRIQFMGTVSGKELITAYQRADIFVLPTSNDSCPTAIIEAMACGLAVVSTTVGDIPMLVEDGTGLLIAPRDTPALAEKIAELLCNPARTKSYGEAARTKVIHDFNWRERANRYNDLFEDVVGKLFITHVTAYYPPHVGGIERAAKILAELLAKRRHEITVLTSRSGVREHSSVREKHLTVKKISSFEFAHTPFAPSLLWHLLSLPQKSIIHLHLAQAYWPELVWFAATVKRLPYLVHFHLDIEASGTLGFLFTVYKKIFWGPFLRGASAVVVCSDEQAALVEKRYGVQKKCITTIQNGVSDDFFSDRVYEPSRRMFRLLYIGRLAPQKRVERLIDAMRLINIPVHLTIVGDGEDRPKLEALVRAYGLSTISFVGEKNDAQMRAYHREHDAFVISSHKEGVPLAVLEAMAAGLPIIGSNVTGIRELLQGTGVLVDEPYPHAFAHALEALWNDPARLRELSRASAQHAKQFSWQRRIPEIEAVYRRISQSV